MFDPVNSSCPPPVETRLSDPPAVVPLPVISAPSRSTPANVVLVGLATVSVTPAAPPFSMTELATPSSPTMDGLCPFSCSRPPLPTKLKLSTPICKKLPAMRTVGPVPLPGPPMVTAPCTPLVPLALPMTMVAPPAVMLPSPVLLVTVSAPCPPLACSARPFNVKTVDGPRDVESAAALCELHDIQGHRRGRLQRPALKNDDGCGRRTEIAAARIVSRAEAQDAAVDECVTRVSIDAAQHESTGT